MVIIKLDQVYSNLDPVCPPRRAPKDHFGLLLGETTHVAHSLDDFPPLVPRAPIVIVFLCSERTIITISFFVVIHADGADGPITAKQDALGAEGGHDDGEPRADGLEDGVGGGGLQGGGHFREAAGEFHIDVVCFGEGVDGGAPGDEGGVGGVEDGKVWFTEMVCFIVSEHFFDTRNT